MIRKNCLRWKRNDFEGDVYKTIDLSELLCILCVYIYPEGNMHVYIRSKIWFALEYYSGVHDTVPHTKTISRAIVIYIGDMREHRELCVTSSRLIFDSHC